MKNILIHATLFLISVLLVFLIAFIQKVTVSSEAELFTIRCGWPIAFVINNQSQSNPSFPWTTSCFEGEYGTNITIFWLAAFGNASVYYAILRLLLRISRRMSIYSFQKTT